ncbi:GTPase [Massilia brevitalea]|uniref:GTPase n=1 Tax=Massilia brevitalea TaxID=442526 RepID=UPI0027393321|nr:GTPase [Massilia brevitalea]
MTAAGARAGASAGGAIPIATTIVTGPGAGRREAAIAALIDPTEEGASAVILEGLPDGTLLLEPSSTLLLARIAPGCLCCAGNLVMRVTLNRLLRRKPTRLFIGLASGEHLGQLRSWLSSAPYDQLLSLTPDRHT